MRRFSAFTAALLAVLIVQRPGPATGQVIVNGGRIIITDFLNEGGAQKAEPDPAGPHVLEFFDGRRLHGTLSALDLSRQEITWKRPDASVQLTIPTREISRLTLVPPPRGGENVNVPGLELVKPPKPPAGAKESKNFATVGFVGGDWLAATVDRIQDKKMHLQLADGSPLEVDSAQVGWIYFSHNATAPECYEGPASMSGWSSGGGWTYRDDALHALAPSQIMRPFATLPDQVEYSFEADQANMMTAFNVTLHQRVTQGWSNEPPLIQCMLRASILSVYANTEGRFKNEQVDLTKTFGSSLDGRKKNGQSNPIRFQAFEDFTGGRLAIFINGRKAGEWNIAKGESGKNRGAFAYQPTMWSSTGEQSISKIRIVPWDGRVPADEEPAADHAHDHLSLSDGTFMDGKLIDLAAGTARLRANGATAEVPRDQVRLLRLAHPDAAPQNQTPPVARVRLIQGGEFDAANVDWHDGKLQIKTRFGGTLPVALAAVSELGFLQTPPALATADDVLVFQDGDRLKGKLDVAEENQKVRWRTDAGAAPVEFDPGHILGIRSGWSEEPGKSKVDCVARFRNGDWLAGRFLTLDKDTLVIDTPDAGQLSLSRALVRALYFSKDGSLPVSDGAADDREWLRGLDLKSGTSASTSRRLLLNGVGTWHCFDGTYSLTAADNGEAVIVRGATTQIGRLIEQLPSLVEVSFDVIEQRGQILFSAQLFSEPTSPGYFMQLHSQGLYIYDMNPSSRTRGGIVPQQVQFEGKLSPESNRRHVQLLANRDTGTVIVMVDGVVITRYGGKAGAPPRPLGRGLTLSPQQNLPCAFANIWVGPWNGRVPGKSPASDTNQDTAILNNGDEAPGSVDIATPSTVKLSSDVGPLDLPLDRVTMIDFGGAEVARTLGARLHLAGAGCLTVDSYRVQDNGISCRSEMVGELRLPLHSVQELVFTAPSKPSKKQEE
jgi:hypothetical protein